ncbi:hypothetical protein MYCTH_116885 [Thermothelomyces thermophilus ATCC 42464]|uniref:Uncharacterized protein n=1 Tax=Thermothelomyces thermophilus (strain ATCC 42464 / BCRC 31852 / DSM 1799) TaxID=573729 RepID=G2QK37_THET4|nr:uncharacterized protein MYCTH_116885 [Thermothelomyces thermophilus ATCC 42464]AEO59943.1 hypothetical protein MYCTH_116885 [Thermothelomyces thermophilus ATCC 42464]
MDIPHQLQASLSTTSIPVPSLAWLEALAGARSPAPPLASLLATARARLLASDLTAPGLLDARYAAAHSLPARLAQTHAGTREAALPHDVVVQVLDVEDVARSRWEQVEALEALERGEGTRGREIIRLNTASSSSSSSSGADGTAEGAEEEEEEEGGNAAAGAGGGGGGGGRGGATSTSNNNNNNNSSSSSSSSKNGTHKLVVQDCKGQKVHAIELKRVERLGVGRTFIGEKILLRAGTVLARGVVLLDPAHCVVLGGKVESWHRAWLDGRLARLKEAVGADRRT